jgi:hypothetical protein
MTRNQGVFGLWITQVLISRSGCRQYRRLLPAWLEERAGREVVLPSPLSRRADLRQRGPGWFADRDWRAEVGVAICVIAGGVGPWLVGAREVCR